jgi:hypothetical protein
MPTPRLRVLLATGAIAVTPFLLAGCVTPSPSPGTNAALGEVAAFSASNAWAGGQFHDGAGQHELMEHWNGKSWQVASLPPPLGNLVFAITAVNGSNVWAVDSARTLHYGGLGWRSIPNPVGITVSKLASAPDGAVFGIGSDSTLLAMTAGGWRTVSAVPMPTSHRACDGGPARPTDLSVLSTNDIWVVGNTFGTGADSATSCTFAIHWNGTTWQPFATPTGSGGEPQLNAVSARTANDVWAVGVRITTTESTGRENDSSLAMHWNGASWSLVSTVDSLGGGRLQDVDATAAGVWAVGTAPQLGGFTSDMLIKKWTGTALLDQPIQRLPVAGQRGMDSGFLNAVSVRDGVVVSVGSQLPTANVIATLTDRRNAT